MIKKIYKKSTTKILTTRFKAGDYQFILDQAHNLGITVSDYIRFCTIIFPPADDLNRYKKKSV